MIDWDNIPMSEVGGRIAEPVPPNLNTLTRLVHNIPENAVARYGNDYLVSTWSPPTLGFLSGTCRFEFDDPNQPDMYMAGFNRHDFNLVDVSTRAAHLLGADRLVCIYFDTSTNEWAEREIELNG